jgi:alpha-tubulin suppressor-like RCC1 family protein
MARSTAKQRIGLSLIVSSVLASCSSELSSVSPHVDISALELSSGWTHVTSGYAHTCGLKASDLYCWGNSLYGQAGPSSGFQQVNPSPVMRDTGFATIAAGGYHTCGIRRRDGRVQCWGRSTHLESGSTFYRTDVALQITLPAPLVLDSISAGLHFACGITPDDRAYCWGDNRYRQVGNVGVDDCAGLGSSCNRRAAEVVGGHHYRQISAGGYHACGVRTDLSAICWGRNESGQIGSGSIDFRLDPTPVQGGHSFQQLAAGENFTCGLTTGGRIYCWGDNQSGQLGIGTRGGNSSTPVQIASPNYFVRVEAGAASACGIDFRNQAVCWGDGSWGNLGIGNRTDATIPYKVAGGLAFQQLSAGMTHSCGITVSSELYCWGGNTYGQLGTGNTTETLTPTPTL